MKNWFFISFLFLSVCQFFAKADENEIVKGFYWIDNENPIEFTGTSIMAEAANCKDGIHVLNLVAQSEDKGFTTPVSAMFAKLSLQNLNGICFIDGDLQTPIPITESEEGIYHFDFDVNKLSVGAHHLQFICQNAGGYVSDFKSAWFFRNPTLAEYEDAHLTYFIDGKTSGQISLNKSADIYSVDIETKELSTGIHSIDFIVVLSGGIVSDRMTSWFYKAPVPPGVKFYEYWFDEDYENSVLTNLNEAEANFELIKMIDVPDLPFSSRNYAFSFVDDKVQLNGVNKFSMRFTESDGRNSLRQAEFINSQKYLTKTDFAQLESGENIIRRPEANDFEVLKFEGEIGDSIALKGNQAYYYELYSPSALKIISSKGSQTESLRTSTLRETGTYYLVVHDIISNSNKEVKLEFVHIPRLAILNVNPTVSSSSSMFTLVNVFGNGMMNAKKVVIKTSEGYTLENDDPFVYDNYNLLCSFNNDNELPLGKYDLSITFEDPVTGEMETLTKNSALSIIEGEKSNIKVEIIPSGIASTPYMVSIRITNDSDSPCWGIPFNIACERDGGRNGFIFYMRDLFSSNEYSLDNIQWYESDNILNTGVDGLYFPLMLDYMSPHETRTMRVGITSEPHKRIGLYAWAGTPFNEEMAELSSIPEEAWLSMDFYLSNTFSYKTLIYWDALLSMIMEENQGDIHTLAVPANKWLIDILLKYGADKVGKLPVPFALVKKLADSNAHISKATAYTLADIVNMGPIRHSYEYLKDNGIPGSNILEQLENFYREHPNDREDGTWKHIIDEAEINLARLISPKDIAKEALKALPKSNLLDDAIDCFLDQMAESPDPMPKRREIYTMMSKDPNMITGYVDPSGGNYIGQAINKLDYTIEFENDSTIATAPASTIIVENNLDGNIFDLSTFTATEITIGKHKIKAPSSNSFIITNDMRPEINCIAEIRQEFCAATGELRWIFRSLDPMTLEDAENYVQGLLPVNTSDNIGIGTISYTVNLNSGLPHLTKIENKASIIFDDNEVIETPVWTNFTDYELPTAQIDKEYGYQNGCYSFDISASDVGSGIMKYDLYCRINEDDQWHLILPNQTDSHIELPMEEPIEGLRFMVLATDNAGNQQEEYFMPPTVDEEIISADNLDENEQVWYNLQGVMVSSDESSHRNQVIISNKGRKVIIK